VQKGDRAWPASDDANTYEAADNAKVVHNTFLNCKQPFFLGRNSSGSGAVDPTGVMVCYNIVQSSDTGGPVFDIDFSTTVIGFRSNYVHHPGSNYGVTGLPGVTYGAKSPDLRLDTALGYAVLSASSPVLEMGDGMKQLAMRGMRTITRSARDKGRCCEWNEPCGRDPVPIGRGNVGPCFYGGPADSFNPTATSESGQDAVLPPPAKRRS